jgi:hypothetical protein
LENITSATADALIFYTTTGNTPVVGTGFTKLYTGPFLLAASANIKAIGIKSGFTSSAIVSVFLTITPSAPVVATPVISPGTGIYAGNQTVSISCATPGATIYYTISGNTPVIGTGFTRIYTGSFVVNKTTTVRAMATLSGSTNSAVAASFITIAPARLATADSEEPGSPPLGADGFRVYPNPSSDLVNIQPETKIEHAALQVFNAMGQLVYYRPVAEFEKETVSLAGLPKGIYSIKISATGFEKTIRILKN